MAINLYEILNIKPTASTHEIEAAIAGAEQSGIDPAMINAAKQFLLDKEKRKKYNLMLNRKPSANKEPILEPVKLAPPESIVQSQPTAPADSNIKFCSACGTKLESNQAFCSGCGVKLGSPINSNMNQVANTNSQKIPVGSSVCSDCGWVGFPKTRVKGSIGIEIVLWLFMLIPGVIYSIWRQTTKEKACSACGSNKVIPSASPVGRQLIAEFVNSETMQPQGYAYKKEQRSLLDMLIWLFFAGMIFILVFSLILRAV